MFELFGQLVVLEFDKEARVDPSPSVPLPSSQGQPSPGFCPHVLAQLAAPHSLTQPTLDIEAPQPAGPPMEPRLPCPVQQVGLVPFG